MNHVLLPLAVLACPVGMGVMMFVMMRSGSQGRSGSRLSPPPPAPPERDEELAALRAEVNDLRARQQAGQSTTDTASRGLPESAVRGRR